MSSVKATPKQEKSSNEVMQQVNIKNAKILAILMTVILSCYHGTQTGQSSCDRLLNSGRYQGNNEWQPVGCLLYKYNQISANKCLRNTLQDGTSQIHFAFVGDSRIRQLYFGVLHLFDETGQPVVVNNDGPTSASDIEGSTLGKDVITDSTKHTAEELPHKKNRTVELAHSDLTYVSKELNLKLTFHWQPIMDNSTFNLLTTWTLKPPSLVIAGGATWSIKLFGDSNEALKAYKETLASLADLTKNWADNKLIWMLQDQVDSSKLSISRQKITNEMIDLYNKAASEALFGSRFKMWTSSRLISEGLGSTSDDGLHIGELPLKHDVQVLLNFYCNPAMKLNDGSCCSGKESPTSLQYISFTILHICLLVTVIWYSIRTLRQRRRQANIETDVEMPNGDTQEPINDKKDPKAANSQNNWQIFFSSMAKLAILMSYFYLCDRANFYMKENKHYSHLSFWLPVVYIFAMGLFFTEESRFTKVLHRDQTDEWKGWMQLVILIYHMTGASQILPIYMQIRVLVSAYLFLTGYGHFSYFWHSGDRSFVRFCQVLFRMNFMTVLLCLCMNRSYQFYYFVPLVSFWYMVVYVILIIPCRVTGSLCEANPMYYLYIIIKFIVLFASITILYMSEVLFERIFSARPIRALFMTYNGEDVREWWFRWSLDRYSVSFGMVFAFLYLTCQKYGWIDDQSRGNLLSRGRSLGLTLLSCIAYLGYTGFTFTCRTKPECNEAHPYVVFLPIIAFILLRNLSGTLRSRYSSFFAWFGRISLELFIGQYHVWLAADTRGVLVLIPSAPVLNVIVTSFIFVCVAHEVHHITGQLLPLAVPSDWKRTVRNLSIFVLILIPIGIHDKML